MAKDPEERTEDYLVCALTVKDPVKRKALAKDLEKAMNKNLSPVFLGTYTVREDADGDLEVRYWIGQDGSFDINNLSANAAWALGYKVCWLLFS